MYKVFSRKYTAYFVVLLVIFFSIRVLDNHVNSKAKDKHFEKAYLKGRSERAITKRRTPVQPIQTTGACDAAASKIVDIVKKTTPTTIDNKGMLPNVNIGRTTDGTTLSVR